MFDCIKITDWLMVIITAIYVYATIKICKYNKESVEASKKQTEAANRQTTEMIRQYNESHRPFVIISFEIIRSGYLCFKLENIGPVVAKDIKIRINEEFLDILEKKTPFTFLRKTTAATLMLTSHQKQYIALGVQGNFDDIASVPAKIDISYNDKYEEHTEIDIAQFGDMLNYNSDLRDISLNIKNIENHLKQIDNEAKNYHKKLIETISNITPVSFLVHTGYERRKIDIYKAVCLNSDSTAEQLAAIVEISKEDALAILKELDRVDKLVQPVKCDDDDFHTKWRRR